MKKYNSVLGKVFILIVTALIIYVAKIIAVNYKTIFTKEVYIILEILPIALATIAISLVLFTYLEGRLPIFEEDKSLSNDNVDLFSNRLKEFERQLNLIDAKQLNNGFSEQKIQESIENILQNQAAENIIAKVESKFGNEIVKQKNYQRISEELNDLEWNISIYIARLNRGSSINLIIGVLTTIIAVIILGFFVFEKEIDYTNTSDVLAHYVPRISIAIFIEIFSFFFLKLYKTNLNDIKYFINERTNLSSKRIALKFAYVIEDKEAISQILNEFAKTERNFKLSKDETTVNLEKLKIKKSDELSLLNNILNVIKLKEK